MDSTSKNAFFSFQTLDPSFTPVDVRPRKKMSITMSIETFDDYYPYYDQDSLHSSSEDKLCSTKLPSKTDIPAIVKGNSDSCLNVSMDEEKDEERQVLLPQLLLQILEMNIQISHSISSTSTTK